MPFQPVRVHRSCESLVLGDALEFLLVVMAASAAATALRLGGAVARGGGVGRSVVSVSIALERFAGADSAEGELHGARETCPASEGGIHGGRLVAAMDHAVGALWIA